MRDRQQWVDEGQRRIWTGPDEPLAALEILCQSCWQAGRGDRRLALVAVSTRTGATSVLLTLVFRTPDGPATSRWDGEGDRRRLRLVCGVKAGRGGRSNGGCRNMPVAPREWICEQLAAIAMPDTRTIGRVYR